MKAEWRVAVVVWPLSYVAEELPEILMAQSASLINAWLIILQVFVLL